MKWSKAGRVLANRLKKASVGIIMALGISSVAKAQQPCLSDWSYRVPITISNTGTTATNYQVLLTFNSSSLVAQSKAKVDAGDIRILDASGNMLDFWIEEGTFNTTTTRMWVKMPTLASGSSVIYLFYGNALAASVASGDATFPVFDDFSNGFDAAKWEVCSGIQPEFSLGNATFNSAGGKSVLNSVAMLSSPIVAEMKISSAGDGLSFIGVQSTSDQGYAVVHDIDNGAAFMRLGFLTGGACASITEETSPNSVQANATTGTWKFSWSQPALQQFSWPGSSGTVNRTNAAYSPTTQSQLTLGNIADLTNNTGAMEVAWVFARKYAAAEPTASLGSETTLLTTITANNGGPYCAGETIQLTASTVSGGSYYWTGPNGFSSNVQNPSFTNASTAYNGTYTLSVSAAASGCDAIITTTDVVVFPQTVAGTLSGASQVCAGNNAGTLNLSGQTGEVIRWESSTTGGAPWSTINETTPTLNYNNLNVTTYFRAIVKSGTCSEKSTNPVEIQVDPQTVAGRVTGSAEVCSGTNSGLLTLTEYTGRVVNWQASTDGGATFTDLSTGSGPQFTYTNLTQTTLYRAVVKSGTCNTAFSEAATVLVNPLPQPAFTATQACQSVATQFVNSATVTSGSITTYNWDFGDGTGSTVQNPRHIYAEAGAYEVTLTTTTAKGCQKSVSQQVTVNYVPTANFKPQNVCLNNAVNFINQTVLPGGTIQSYQWQFGDGNTSTEASPSYTYAAAGTYSVTLSATSDQGCSHTITKSVTIYPRANLSFNWNNACLGEITRFTNNSNISSGNLTYLWDFGDGSSSVQPNPQHTYTEAGEYIVRLQSTSEKGCVDEISREITVYPQPLAGFTFDDVCSDTNAQFTNTSTVDGAGTLKYSWDFGDGETSVQPSPVHQYSRPGTYLVRLTVETEEGGCVSSFQDVIEIFPMPVANFDFDNVCEGNATQFVNTSNIAAGTLFYTWDFGDGIQSNQNEPTHAYAEAGVYNVTLTVQSENRCEDIISRQVTVNALPQPAFSAASVCDGTLTQFQNSSTIANGSISSYLWNFGDGSNSTSILENPSYQYLNPGTYTVSLQATSSQGCTQTYSNTITIGTNPLADFSATAVCLGSPTVFENASFYEGGQLTYQWVFEDGSTVNSTSPNITFSSPGLKKVKLIASSPAGCSDVIEKTVEVFALPTVQLTSDTLISRGYEVQLMAKGGQQYNWAPNDGSLTNINIPNPIARPLETTTYTVTVANAQGCTSTESLTIYVEDDFKISASNVLTPDGNGKNDTWVINNIDAYGQADVSVYDRWGNTIYEARNYQNNWGGTRNNDILPDGTYYYTIRFANSDTVYRGALTIIRNK